MPRLSTANDRGNISVLVAFFVLAVCGVGALMVDSATILIEGRQLQNGAENTALDTAATCAAGSCMIPTAADAGPANGSTGDLMANVELCGTAPGLSPCPPGEADGDRDDDGIPERTLFNCRPLGSTTAPYVQVHASTRDADSGVEANRLQSFFVNALDPFVDDTDEYNGTTVRACARAAFGSPAGLTAELPLAVSTCEVDYWVGLYGKVTAPYPAAAEAILYAHANGGAGRSNCPSRAGSNQDGPGGFGWLQTTGTCSVETTLEGDGTEKPGASIPGDCSAAAFAAMHMKIVNIPVFKTVSENKYLLLGYQPFFLTGYRLSGRPAFHAASPNIGVPCDIAPNKDICISGFFVDAPLIAPGPLVPYTGYGSVAVNLVG